MADVQTLPPTTVTDLRHQVSGPVFVRGDAELADEVACFNTNGGVHDPAIVVGAANPDDVSAAVRFAAEHGLPVRVQATGHGPGPRAKNGMIVSTERLTTVQLDPTARRVTLGAGCQWHRIVTAAAPFGLAPITGSSVTVGAVGHTMGGGIGPLIRSHGFSSDWARGFRLVTANGQILTVDARTHPDLFWALRGGKGGFGIVTEMTLELPHIPVLYAGRLVFEGAANIEAALRAWVSWLPSAADDVSTSVALAPAHGPDAAGGQRLHLRFVYPGPAADGARLVAPLRGAAPTVQDTVREMPLAEVHSIHGDPVDPLPLQSFCTELTGIDQDFASAFLARVGPRTEAPFAESEIRHLGGVAAQDVVDPGAVGGRGGALMLRLVIEDPTVAPRASEIAAGLFADAGARKFSTTNVNFAGSMSKRPAFERSWPEPMRRQLAEVRAAYDPDGLFPFGPAPVQDAPPQAAVPPVPEAPTIRPRRIFDVRRWFGRHTGQPLR
ncbi:MAG TPA: FAD-binding oxidoreductase [Flexivirga sp.]|uniref:FAD-binding oxidoreductase n=1 Tax=Flexivirga sp. TaxID=1962927 RepID=UPI002CA535AF|nr:FAD-binding oxidoreductase [Flexivirga sp.]HWC21130.1 FAD-binding oxidoreductase [Flexivirga sp.]